MCKVIRSLQVLLFHQNIKELNTSNLIDDNILILITHQQHQHISISGQVHKELLKKLDCLVVEIQAWQMQDSFHILNLNTIIFQM